MTSRRARERSPRDVHFLNDDGMVACNPRDREAAHRAEVEGIATEHVAAVTCRKCRAILSSARPKRSLMSGLRKAPGASRLPDVEAEIFFLPTSSGGRQSAALPGYRPAHLIREDYLTTGFHDYLEVSEARPGDTVRATITFISPGDHPHSLWVGKVLSVQEGSHVVGHATITRIFNEQLRATGDPPSRPRR